MNLKPYETLINDLEKAKKVYSQFSKCQAKKLQQQNDQQKLQHMIAKEKQKILEIEKELQDCKKEYNQILLSIGQAHKEAIFHEINDQQIQKQIMQRDFLVMSRAKQVLAEEIKKHQKLELEKSQKKEQILNKRKQLFGKSSVLLRKEAEQIYKQKLQEWTKLENILTKKLEETRQRHPDSNAKFKLITTHLSPKKHDTAQPIKEAKFKNVQIQTEDLKKNEDSISSNMKNVITCKVLENLNHIFSTKNVNNEKLYCDIAVNTSSTFESYDFLSETSYLPFASEAVCKTSIKDKSNAKGEKKTYNLKDPDLRELIKKIKIIRSLVQNQREVTKIYKNSFPKLQEVYDNLSFSSIPVSSDLSFCLFENKSPTISFLEQDISIPISTESSIDFSQFNQDFSVNKEKFVDSVLKLTEVSKDEENPNELKSLNSVENKVCQSTPKKII